jgi:hypothetical protein
VTDRLYVLTLAARPTFPVCPWCDPFFWGTARGRDEPRFVVIDGTWPLASCGQDADMSRTGGMPYMRI